MGLVPAATVFVAITFPLPSLSAIVLAVAAVAMTIPEFLDNLPVAPSASSTALSVPLAVVWVTPLVAVSALPAVAAFPLVFAALSGMSADTRARYVGVASAPVTGPASTLFAFWTPKSEGVTAAKCVPEPHHAKPWWWYLD